LLSQSTVEERRHAFLRMHRDVRNHPQPSAPEFRNPLHEVARSIVAILHSVRVMHCAINPLALDTPLLQHFAEML